MIAQGLKYFVLTNNMNKRTTLGNSMVRSDYKIWVDVDILKMSVP